MPVSVVAPPPTGDDILQRLQKHTGMWWFCNNWAPSGFIAGGSSGTGSIDWGQNNIRIKTGTTSGSYSYIMKSARGFAGVYSWGKRRFLGLYTYLWTYSYQYVWIVSGYRQTTSATTTYEHIGFKLIDGNLYGTVANGTAESTLLLETLTAGVYRRLECAFDPTVPECRFYVDGVYKGALTSNLPTGTMGADYLLNSSV